MDEYLAIIKLFAGNFAPRGWAFCDGSLLPINQNSALYSIIGTTYGGNGTTTFALPDLRGRVPVGAGPGPGLQNRTVGEKAGAETVTLTSGNLPAHAHALVGGPTPVTVQIPTYDPSPVGGGSQISGDGLFGLSSDGNTPAIYAEPSVPAAGYLPLVTATVTLAGQTAVAGQSQAFATMPPFLGLSYIICLEGLYPSRP